VLCVSPEMCVTRAKQENNKCDHMSAHAGHMHLGNWHNALAGCIAEPSNVN